MPTVSSGSGASAADVFYEVRSNAASISGRDADLAPGIDILMIMGFGATMDCWEPQLDGLLRHPGDEVPVRVCLLDNRGVGRSSSPKPRTAYTTSRMADDCITILDALKWGQVHVIGHSMGAMIATQLASMHPERLLSLTLISVTAGRWQSVPTNWAAIKYAWQVPCSSPLLCPGAVRCASLLSLLMICFPHQLRNRTCCLYQYKNSKTVGRLIPLKSCSAC